MLDVFPQFPLVEVLEDGVGALIEGALEQHGAQHDGEGESGGAAEERAVRLPEHPKYKTNQPNIV